MISVPSSGLKSLAGRVPVEVDLSRPILSDNDPFVIQDWSSPSGWRRNSGGPGLIPVTPSSVSGPRLFDDVPYEPGRVGSKDYPDLDLRPSPSRLNSLPPSPDALDLHRAFLRMPGRANSEPQVPNPKAKEPMLPRRWFSVKERKSLNPQAEEFNLKTSSPFLQHRTGVPASFDALNPSITNLAASTRSSSSNHNNTAASSPFFSKAFAPSPAERAALGMGTLNVSLEKLPSLSDVGSLNSSPAHINAVPAVASPPVVSAGPEVESSFTRSMAWLNALPRRKPKFSPWEDDEH